MPEPVHKGSCACGQVQVETRSLPYRVGVCHCITCRKAQGAPFNFYAVFRPEAVTLSGDVSAFASTDKVRRYSCRKCGSPIYSTYLREDEFYVQYGSFEDVGTFHANLRILDEALGAMAPSLPDLCQPLR
ncbi:MAG: GFA family protein [Methyloceanibacter sp.]|jgi:hypothetical protein|uniref:GFA family protein n=1 Tax=Methyloceanibacter sp. TaxID=1965321 RepID=UPI003C353138